MKSVIIIVLLTLSLKAYGQDPYFSQFYANPAYLNPSLSGSTGMARASVLHRQQWTKLDAYTSSVFTFDNPIGKQTGMALSMMHDNQLDGVIKNYGIHTSLAHRVPLANGGFIAGGVQVGYLQKNFNWNNLTFEDQLRLGADQIYPTAERLGAAQISMLDVGISASMATNDFMLGINVSHLNQPIEQFSTENEGRLPRRFTVHAAYNFFRYGSRANYNIVPSVVYEKQGATEYINVGAYFSNDLFTVGLWNRYQEAIIASAGMKVGQFNFGYSYDHMLQTQSTNFGATHEISLSFRFQLNDPDAIKKYKGECPEIFNRLR